MADQSIVDEAQARAMRRLANPDDGATRWFWLSFVDPALPEERRLIGCTVVEADDIEEAIAASHLRQVNPGGDVEGVEFEDDGTFEQKLKIAFMLNRLRTKAEMEAEGVI